MLRRQPTRLIPRQRGRVRGPLQRHELARSRRGARDRDEAAVRALLRWFSPRTGGWKTPTGEAWQPALAIEALLNVYERTGDVGYLNVIEKSFARYRGRRSSYVDDNGWYLNAWLRAYDVTGDPKYLDEAVGLFAAMAQAWDATCGGGLWWHHERSYKNAITSELFLLAAARLHRRAPERGRDGSYLAWAERTWDWFDTSGMINSDDLVNDGLTDDCVNNGETTWTYNQGVILAGLVELWRCTGDDELLARARRIATAATTTLVDAGGILREPPEPGACEPDQQIFKGILAQGLARLHHADPDRTPALARFLTANADSLWRTREFRGRFGVAWRSPDPGGPAREVRDAPSEAGRDRPDRARPVRNAATQASAALLFSSIALLAAGGEATTVRSREGTALGLHDAVRGDLGPRAGRPWRTDGQYVTFFATGPLTRLATLTLHYSAGAGDAYRYLEVNGAGRADRLLFAGTPGWGAYSSVSLDALLHPGENTISVIYDSSRASANDLVLDGLRLTPVPVQ